MKRPGSLLRLRPESESDDNEVEEEMTMDQTDSEDITEEPETSGSKQKIKIRKKGIVYISSIPKHMNVAICREMMERFGEVGRIFLQPDSKGSEYIKEYLEDAGAKLMVSSF